MWKLLEFKLEMWIFPVCSFIYFACFIRMNGKKKMNYALWNVKNVSVCWTMAAHFDVIGIKIIKKIYLYMKKILTCERRKCISISNDLRIGFSLTWQRALWFVILFVSFFLCSADLLHRNVARKTKDEIDGATKRKKKHKQTASYSGSECIMFSAPFHYVTFYLSRSVSGSIFSSFFCSYCPFYILVVLGIWLLLIWLAVGMMRCMDDDFDVDATNRPSIFFFPGGVENMCAHWNYHVIHRVKNGCV